MRILLLLIATSLILSCNKSSDAVITNTPADMSRYPAALQEVFAAHGGLETWQSMQSLSYELIKGEEVEKQWVSLHDRRERIEANNFTMGHDGKKTWVEADTSYKGNPVFYKNLMFYFYAMPFVIADEGINYSETQNLVFDGKSYPGVKISYNDGVGVSPKDEYFVHYDPTTKKMEWLGYTVTYFSGEKSPKISWIRYTEWDTFEGLLLPTELSWQNVEDNIPTGTRNTRVFKNVKISTTPMNDEQFAMTEGAVIVE